MKKIIHLAVLMSILSMSCSCVAEMEKVASVFTGPSLEESQAERDKWRQQQLEKQRERSAQEERLREEEQAKRAAEIKAKQEQAKQNISKPLNMKTLTCGKYIEQVDSLNNLDRSILVGWTMGYIAYGTHNTKMGPTMGKKLAAMRAQCEKTPDENFLKILDNIK